MPAAAAAVEALLYSWGAEASANGAIKLGGDGLAISPTETGVAAQLYPAGRTIMGCGPVGPAGKGVGGPNVEVPGGGPETPPFPY